MLGDSVIKCITINLEEIQTFKTFYKKKIWNRSNAFVTSSLYSDTPKQNSSEVF